MAFYKATYHRNEVVHIDVSEEATQEEVVIQEDNTLLYAIVHATNLVDAEAKAIKLGFQKTIDSGRLPY